MKLNDLSHLKSLKKLQPIKPLHQVKIFINTSLLSEIELISYTANLCLFCTRILRDEIQIKNRNEVIYMANNELLKLNSLLSKKDFLLHSNYTKKDTKDFFKKIGLKPKHIKN